MDTSEPRASYVVASPSEQQLEVGHPLLAPLARLHTLR
jgi:hypothetical protein